MVDVVGVPEDKVVEVGLVEETVDLGKDEVTVSNKFVDEKEKDNENFKRQSTQSLKNYFFPNTLQNDLYTAVNRKSKFHLEHDEDFIDQREKSKKQLERLAKEAGQSLVNYYDTLSGKEGDGRGQVDVRGHINGLLKGFGM